MGAPRPNGLGLSGWDDGLEIDAEPPTSILGIATAEPTNARAARQMISAARTFLV